MGGSDDSSNLILLTVEEHAEAHRILHEQYGKEEDRIAWLALSSQLEKKSIVELGLKLGRQVANRVLEEKYGENWKHIIAKKGSNRLQEILKEDPDYLSKKNVRAFLGKNHSDETKLKIGKKNSMNQSATKNSQYGTMWITNGTDSIKIKKDEPIPEGWNKGRKCNSTAR